VSTTIPLARISFVKLYLGITAEAVSAFWLAAHGAIATMRNIRRSGALDDTCMVGLRKEAPLPEETIASTGSARVAMFKV